MIASAAVSSSDFASVRATVLAAINDALDELNAYAVRIDRPEPGIVECADWLDRAREALDGAP